MKKESMISLPINHGIHFSFRGSENTGSKVVSVILGTLLSYLLALGLGFGALLTFTSMFAIPFDPVVFGFFVPVFTFIMMVLYQMPKKVVGFSSLGVLVLLVAVLLIFWNETVSGFGYIRDFVLVGICKAMYWKVPELSYTFTEAMKVDTTFLLCLVATPLMTGISYFTIRKVNFLLLFLFTFPFFEIGAAFGCVPDHFCFALLLAGWTGCFSMYLAAKVRKIRKRRGEKKSRVTATKRKQSFVAAVGIVVAVLTFIMFSFGHFMVAVAGYDRPEDMKALRSDIKASISDFIDYILGQDHDGSLKEGLLYQMDDRVIKNRRYMTIELPFREQTYLRGFVGVSYEGDRWLPYDESDANEWLDSAYASTGYYPQNAQGILANSQIKTNAVAKQTAATVSISNLRRKKDYAYSAYIPYFEHGFTYTGDTIVTPVNKSAYSYTAFMDNRNFYSANLTDLYYTDEFQSIWEEYQNYVKQVYTRLPSNLPELQTIVDDLKQGDKYGYDTHSFTHLETADRIRAYLAKKMEYSLEVDKLPKDTDFATWVASGEAESGYSAHYASTLAVMMRLAGVPTRYVEGYIITREDYETATNNGDGYFTMDLTDLSAHAWIEVYESNYGWVPIEATPGFYTGSLLDGMGNTELDESETEEAPAEEIEEIIDDPESEEEIKVPPPPEVKEEEEKKEETSSPFSVALQVLQYLGVGIVVLILLAIVLAVLAMIVLSIRRWIRLGVLNRSLRQTEPNRLVVAIYRYYHRLLKFEKLENSENLPYLTFAAYICEQSDCLQGDRHLLAMEIFLKHRFSQYTLNEEELMVLQTLVIEYRRASLKQLSGSEKFRFMFIDNLG